MKRIITICLTAILSLASLCLSGCKTEIKTEDVFHNEVLTCIDTTTWSSEKEGCSKMPLENITYHADIKTKDSKAPSYILLAKKRVKLKSISFTVVSQSENESYYYRLDVWKGTAFSDNSIDFRYNDKEEIQNIPHTLSEKTYTFTFDTDIYTVPTTNVNPIDIYSVDKIVVGIQLSGADESCKVRIYNLSFEYEKAKD